MNDKLRTCLRAPFQLAGRDPCRVSSAVTDESAGRMHSWNMTLGHAGGRGRIIFALADETIPLLFSDGLVVVGCGFPSTG